MDIKNKCLIVFLLVNLLIILGYMNCFEARASLLDTMESQAGTFLKTGQDESDDLSKVTNVITSNFKGLGNILTMIGAGVMVAATAYMGIKYMMSPPDKQAALKQQLMGLVVAGIVIFGAYAIWKAVIGIVSKF